MKLCILRDTAVTLLSTYLTLQIDNQEQLENELLDTAEEFNEHQLADPFNIELVVDLNRYRLRGVTNQYLAKQISVLLGADVDIVGSCTPMQVCPCCGYRTLDERGMYDICEVCKWEDVGDIPENEYSSPNRMTLHEAKNEFKQRLSHHAMSDELLSKYYYGDGCV